MAIDGSMTLIDDYGRKTIKRIESTETVLATALTSFGAYADDLQALTDCQLTKITYRSISTAKTFAVTSGANVDVGATFRLLLDNGKEGAHKIPSFKISLVGANGVIDCTAQAITDYFANFLTGGTMRLNDGNYVVSVLSGQLDR